MQEDKQVVRTQKWEIEIIEYSDGNSTMCRTNTGFSPLELLGITTYVQQDILKQIAGEIKPNIIKRDFITTDDKKPENK